MSKEERNIRRYLLGEMSEAERAALEREYFIDRQLFDRVVRVENELVDGYARGLLPPPTREQFVRHYLAHPRRRVRAEFAEALAARLAAAVEVAAAPPSRSESWFGRLKAPVRGPRLSWALPAALLLTLAVAAWLFVKTGRPPQEAAKSGAGQVAPGQQTRERQGQVADERRPPEDSADGQARPTVERRAARPSPTPPPKGAPVLASLVLTVSGVRGSDTTRPPVLLIDGRTERVRLRVNLRESDYDTYRAVLRPAGGGEIFAWQRVSPKRTKSGAAVTLILGPQKFADGGDYILTLSGVAETGEVEEVSKSLFRVRKK